MPRYTGNFATRDRFARVLLDNFGAASAVFTGAAASLSMIFVFGYLTPFNVFLIMTVEYTDILKFILIGICLLVITLSTLVSISYVFISLGNTTYSIVILALSLAVIIFIQGSNAVESYNSSRPDFYFQLLRLTNTIVGVVIVRAFWKNIYRPKLFTVLNLSATIFMLYFFVYALGITFGLYVREIGGPLQVIIRENNNTDRTINDAKLVMFTSHHTVIFAEDKISTFQTSDVREISSQPNAVYDVHVPILGKR